MSRAQVLIVDDEAGIREVTGEFLTGEGYDVVFADTAIGALTIVKRRAPDVVLLDLMMPGAVVGDDVVGALARHTAVVVMTGIDDADRARRTLAAGAFDFVMKPASLGRIGDVIEAAVLFRRSQVTA